MKVVVTDRVKIRVTVRIVRIVTGNHCDGYIVMADQNPAFCHWMSIITQIETRYTVFINMPHKRYKGQKTLHFWHIMN